MTGVECSVCQDAVCSLLPTQATGPEPHDAALTYEISLRVGDGFRWTRWSHPSEDRGWCALFVFSTALLACPTQAMNFAISPQLVEAAPVNVETLARLLDPVGDTVAKAEPVNADLELLSQTGRITDGAEPPTWVSVARGGSRARGGKEEKENLQEIQHVEQTRGQFVVTWPNLPPHAYCQPDLSQLSVFEEPISFETRRQVLNLRSHVFWDLIFVLW